MQLKPLSVIAFALVLVGISCTTNVGHRMHPSHYPFLEHATSTQPIVWRKHTGPDFDVFYGQAKNRKNSGFGFYRGGHPRSTPDGTSIISGSLGAFSVEWHETLSSDPPRIYRTAVFDYQTRIVRLQKHEREFRFIERIHVWVYGDVEEDVASWTAYLAGLRLFREKPEDTVELR